MGPPEDAAILQALHVATTSAQRDKSITEALDRLATTLSVPQTQRLLDAAFRAHAGLALPPLLPQLKQVASVCTAPPRKAECVGHALLEQLVSYVIATSSHPEALRASQETLLAVYQANPAVAGGLLSAIDSEPPTRVTVAVTVARPFLIAALIEGKPRHVQKLAIIQSLVRTAWSASSNREDDSAQTVVSRILVRAATLFPLSVNGDAWVVYPSLVASAVDLLVAVSSPADTASVAHAVLCRVLFGLQHQLSVISLLQSLVELADAAPRVLYSSTVVYLLGHVLLHDEVGSREQGLVLKVLRSLLPAASLAVKNGRTVYIEVLVVPLVSVLPTHPQDAPHLLQLVLETAATTQFQYEAANVGTSPLGTEAAHAASFVVLASSPAAYARWLQSLLEGKELSEVEDPLSTLLIQLGASLVDRRERIRLLALEALDRQLKLRRVNKSKDWPSSAYKLIVSALVVLTSFKSPTSAIGENSELWLSECFQVLASLAATTTETMKIILRLIRRMAVAFGTVAARSQGLRPQALHLMLLVWKQDSRVYPQLEVMLRQDDSENGETEEDNEMTIVRMATILAICEKDPETGVEWISELQAFLEHDSVSVVAMAVRAVTLLCIGDCLDYETTVKIFITKLKKQRISCADEPLFHEELCRFYAFGGTLDFVETSPKYSARVLEELWEYANEEIASVRQEAWAALNSYSIEALGLRLVGTPATRMQDEDDDEDELTEEDVEENVDRVWTCLRTESDARVRAEIEKTVTRILDAESKKLAPGGASRIGTGVASVAAFSAPENRISAAATKELKKQLPARQAVIEQIDPVAEWRAFLLAYESTDVVESAAAPKRKDKRLRLVNGHVDEMKTILQRSLEASTSRAAKEAEALTHVQFLRLLQSVEAWHSFGRKYFGRVEELALLRTPMDAPTGHTAGVLSKLVDEQLSLLQAELEHSHRWLAIGALVHHAAVSSSSTALDPVLTKWRATLRAQLLQSMEELRVFKDVKHAIDMQHVLLAMVLANPKHLDSSLDALVDRATRVIETIDNDLLRAAAILFVGHVCSLKDDTEDRAARSLRIQKGAHVALATLVRSARGPAAANAVSHLLGDSASAHPVVDSVLKSSSKASFGEEVATQWAAAMSLAQVSSCFAAVHRLAWLDNVRLLLTGLWEEEVASAVSANAVAVGLGSVLLESVQHNRIASSDVQKFVSAMLPMLSSGQAEYPCGAVTVSFVLQRMAEHGCVVSTDEIDSLIEFIEAGASTADVSCCAAGNLLHGSTGVLLVPSVNSFDREVTLDPARVGRLKASLEFFRGQNLLDVTAVSSVVLAAIADRGGCFYAAQKNKTFDAQLTTIPTTSLTFKLLDYARRGGDDGAPESDIVAATQSTLTCLAQTSRVQPLAIDLSSLVLRVASRHAATDGILKTCVDLAASHASGVSLVIANLLLPERLLNYAPDVLLACVNTLETARSRLTSLQLADLVGRLFDALVANWCTDPVAVVLTGAFEKLFDVVGCLCEVPNRKEGNIVADDEADAAADAISTLVLNKFIPGLPFTPQSDSSRSLLRRLAEVVLLKVSQRDAVIRSVTVASQAPWAWWRSGHLLSELLRFGAVSSSSVVFRWLLQLDFSTVGCAEVMDTFSTDVVCAVCDSSGKKPPLEMNDAWLLELLDAVSRTTEQDESSALKRRVFFSVVERVISWKETRGREKLLLSGDFVTVSRGLVEEMLVALVAHSLQHHHHERSAASSSLAQRLWTFQFQAGEASRLVEAILAELHIVATEVPLRLLTNDTERDLLTQLSLQ